MKIIKMLFAILLTIGVLIEPVIIKAENTDSLYDEKIIGKFSSNEYVELKKQYEYTKSHRNLKETDIKKLEKIIDNYPEYI